MPQGFPGRRSFVYFPNEKLKVWRDEAKSLRKCFIFIGPLQVFLVLCDIFIYEFEIPILVMDMVMLWLCFYNYMTLNKITIAFQILGYILATFMSFSHLERVIKASVYVKWAYLIQFIILYPIFVAIL